MFGLGVAQKVNFVAYSTQFVPGNVVLVAIDICENSQITGEWIYGIMWNSVYFNITVLFIADTTSILTSFRMGFSGLLTDWEGGGGKSVTHILP